jgi:hypothetical protein
MLIERTSKKSILPAAVDALLSVQSEKTYCEEYAPPKRQPLGLYNLALSKVLQNFEQVLDALDIILRDEPYRDETQYGRKFDSDLINSQEALIKSIQEYFDGCMDTLRCFYPVSIGSKNKFFWKETIAENYWQAINDFFEHVSAIANHIKHNGGRLIFSVIFNDEYAIPGYFADSVDLEGNIAPYRKIHQPVRSLLDPTSGEDTAFSFFRDLRYLLWGVYFVSYHLAEAILTKHGLSQATDYATPNKHDNTVINIAKRISQLSRRFYSDELYKSIPQIEVIEQEGETILKLAYPYESLLIASHGKHQNLVMFVADGSSKSYRFPYRKGKL